MFCSKCGAQLDDNAAFCSKCGNSVNGAKTISYTKAAAKDQSKNQKNSWNCHRCNNTVVLEFKNKKIIFWIIGLIVFGFLFSIFMNDFAKNSNSFVQILYLLIVYGSYIGAVGLATIYRVKSMERPCENCGLPLIVSMQAKYFSKKPIFEKIYEKLNNYNWYITIKKLYNSFLSICVKIFRKFDIFNILSIICIIMSIIPYFKEITVSLFEDEIGSSKTFAYIDTLFAVESKADVEFFGSLLLIYIIVIPSVIIALNQGRIMRARKIPLILYRIKFWFTVAMMFVFSADRIAKNILGDILEDWVEISVDFNGVRFSIIFWGFLALILIRLSYDLEKKKWKLANNVDQCDNDTSNVDGEHAKTINFSIVEFAKSVFAKAKSLVNYIITKFNISIKLFAIIVSSVIVAIVFIVILITSWPKADAFVIAKNDILLLYDDDDGKNDTVIISKGEVLGRLEDVSLPENSEYFDRSVLGDVVAFIAYDGEIPTLYAVYDDKIITVAEDVYTFNLAANGDAVAYVDEDDVLYLYTFNGNKRKEISDETIIDGDIPTCAISPDGKTVAYIEGTYDDYTMYIYNGGKRNKFGDSKVPFAISDDAKLIYYIDGEKMAVYVQSGDDTVKLGSYYDMGDSFILNYDHTQIMFEYNSKTYISDNGGDKIKISSGTIELAPIIIEQLSYYAEYDYVITLNIKDFSGQYFLDEFYNLCYIDKKFEVSEIAEDVSEFNVSRCGKKVYYLMKNTELYSNAKNSKKFKKIDERVMRFDISLDGEQCYYIDWDNNLMYSKNAGKGKKVASDVVLSVCVTHDNYALYIADADSYYSEGTLYSAYKGKKKSKIADEVLYYYDVYTTPNGTYYIDGNNIFYGTSKKDDFKILLEEFC